MSATAQAISRLGKRIAFTTVCEVTHTGAARQHQGSPSVINEGKDWITALQVETFSSRRKRAGTV